MATVSDSTQLRNAIQDAFSGDPTINVLAGTYSSVTTLAKLPSYVPRPAVPFNGYSVIGTTPRENTVINNTRIYQQNIDGSFAPSTVKDLTLQYNTSANNTAILRATSGSYTLDNLLITGQHSGWAGNGGVYMSLASSWAVTNSVDTSINANLTLKNSTISVTGQSGTAAFLQVWNNNGNTVIGDIGAGNTFNEAGYNRGSFHFATMYKDGVQSGNLGTYNVKGNTFTGGGTTKANSNRLEHVYANFNNNTFQNGSYLDLAGTQDLVTLSNNNFITISNGSNITGPGIRFTQKSSSGALLNLGNIDQSVSIQDNVFSGHGVAFINNDIDPANPTPNTPIGTATQVSLTTTNTFYAGTIDSAGTIGPATLTRIRIGGSYGDSITGTNGPNDYISGGAGNDTINAQMGDDWIIGGQGNDTISGGLGTDLFLYYHTTEGTDTITDFTSGSDRLAFRGNTSGGSNFFNFAPGASLTLGTNFITSGSPGTTGPTFIFISGVLSYDADGSGTGAAVNIANFTGTSTAVNASDIKFF
ncbi:MAG: calcium-binding protein [Cyanobacteria bacterium]|nr:calcium-binding protein [Cyanobacteriota bacterium]